MTVLKCCTLDQDLQVESSCQIEFAITVDIVAQAIGFGFRYPHQHHFVLCVDGGSKCREFHRQSVVIIAERYYSLTLGIEIAAKADHAAYGFIEQPLTA